VVFQARPACKRSATRRARFVSCLRAAFTAFNAAAAALPAGAGEASNSWLNSVKSCSRRRCGANERLVSLLGREHDLTLLSQELEASPTLAGNEAAAALKAVKAERKQLTKRARRVAERLHAGRA